MRMMHQMSAMHMRMHLLCARCLCVERQAYNNQWLTDVLMWLIFCLILCHIKITIIF